MNRALLVNDRVDVIDRTASMLSELGWDVYIVAAEELIDLHSKLHSPALVVVDVEMSRGAGFDLILKARQRFKNAFVVAVTRGADKSLWPELVRMCGANRYRVGPVSKSKLASEIQFGVTNGMLEIEDISIQGNG